MPDLTPTGALPHRLSRGAFPNVLEHNGHSVLFDRAFGHSSFDGFFPFFLVRFLT